MIWEVKMLVYISGSFIVNAGTVMINSSTELCCGAAYILFLAFGASD